MLIPAENPWQAPTTKGSCALALCFPPKAGSQDTPIQGGPRIQLQGPVVMENDPAIESLAWRLQWLPSSGQQERRAELPSDQFVNEG